MKKIYAINGSPRKNGNTAQLLQKALDGAASAGAEVKLIQLADLNFSGCLSCFACKRLQNPTPGCALKDDLSEILKELLQADGIIMGSPIYFGAETGLYRNFLEQLFPDAALHQPTEFTGREKNRFRLHLHDECSGKRHG